jgi:hypothetical protein
MAQPKLTGQSGDRVRVEFRLRPYERVLFSLLFGRTWHALALIGIALTALAFVPGLGEWAPLIFCPGILFLLSFVWLPFVMTPRPALAVVTASPGGLEIGADAGSSTVAWSSLRSSRRRAGALVLEMTSGLRMTVPLRLLQTAQVEWIEALVASGSKSQMAPELAGPTLATVRTRLSALDYVLATNTKLEILITAAIGLGVVGLFPFISIALAPLGLAVATLPFWLAPLSLRLSGASKAALGEYELEITAFGYRATGQSQDSWTTWNAYVSVQWRGPILTFQTASSRCVWLLSTRGWSAHQLDVVQRVLLENSLLDPKDVRRVGPERTV